MLRRPRPGISSQHGKVVCLYVRKRSEARPRLPSPPFNPGCPSAHARVFCYSGRGGTSEEGPSGLPMEAPRAWSVMEGKIKPVCILHEFNESEREMRALDVTPRDLEPATADSAARKSSAV